MPAWPVLCACALSPCLPLPALAHRLHHNRQEGCTTLAAERAAEQGHMHILKFLYEEGYEFTGYCLDRAAAKGQLYVLHW